MNFGLGRCGHGADIYPVSHLDHRRMHVRINQARHEGAAVEIELFGSGADGRGELFR